MPRPSFRDAQEPAPPKALSSHRSLTTWGAGSTSLVGARLFIKMANFPGSAGPSGAFFSGPRKTRS